MCVTRSTHVINQYTHLLICVVAILTIELVCSTMPVCYARYYNDDGLLLVSIYIDAY